MKNGLNDRRMGMRYLIDLARSRSSIQLDVAEFTQKVREYASYVHARVQQRDPYDFDRDGVTLCGGPKRAVLDDLEEHLVCTAAAP